MKKFGSGIRNTDENAYHLPDAYQSTQTWLLLFFVLFIIIIIIIY